MKKVRTRVSILAGIGAAGAAGVAALTLAGSPAQAEDPTPSASSSASPSTAARPDREAARAQRQDELAAALATELGIDKAKVAAALEKVQATRETQAKTERIADLETRLDAAVAAGQLTADEAAAILKAAEAGVLPQGGGHGRGGGPGR